MVGERTGADMMNLYNDRGYSSKYAVADRYQRLWRKDLSIDSTKEVAATTLDSFLDEHPDLLPSFLKLDAQGAELDVLEGATKTLRHVGLVQAEVGFSQGYES